ncbi:MAG: ArdC-like ssDNA-binding domain-containing protein [Blastocatellia bacterium]
MNAPQNWHELLIHAVKEPGLLLKAYSIYYGYSIGNQMLALLRCEMRGIEPGPINTHVRWQKLGRQVRKGERALTLCMPLVAKRKNDSDETEQFVTAFVYKPRWFVLSQTDGEPIEMPQIADWSKARALAALNITEATFTDTNGNVQGYARKREIGISPVAAMPHKTLLHELGHIELGHTVELEFNDTEQTPRNLREVEAESIALLCLDALNLDGAAFCRGYVQHWLRGDTIPEASAQKIFGAADRIFRAGRES